MQESRLSRFADSANLLTLRSVERFQALPAPVQGILAVITGLGALALLPFLFGHSYWRKHPLR
jgi:hypothetical protein